MSERTGKPSGSRGRPPYAATTAALLGVVAVSQALPWAQRHFGGNVPPLFARLSPSAGPWLVAAIALAVAAWPVIPRLLSARRWIFLAGVVALGWAAAVAFAVEAHGIPALSVPLRRSLDYQASVPLLRSLGPGAFVRQYPHLTAQLSLHAKTHPPGAVLFLWALGGPLRGNLTAVALVVALVGVLGALPTYAMAREVYGERAARLAAMLFVCAPGVLLYSATSMDAVFMTIGAVALSALVRAPRSGPWAFAAGSLLTLAACFTFGVLAFAPVAIGIGLIAWKAGWRSEPISVVALCRRSLLGAAGALVTALVLREAIGLDLVAVFRSTMRAHLADASRGRPYWYWLFADIPAFLIAAGVPQTALFAAEIRIAWKRRCFGMETVLVATLVAASVSGVFLGEVDHIWLFFMPLLVAPAGSALERFVGVDDRRARLPLVAALATALLMQVLLFTFW